MPSLAQHATKPPWLKVKAPGGPKYTHLRGMFAQLGLHTVCEESHCPNMGECWSGGTATLMLMGDVCTRGCRFCHVTTGAPKRLDPDEPEKVASAIAQMDLTYVVLTSVDRDDLPDGGALHLAKTVSAIKRFSPNVLVEILIPDFRGSHSSLELISESGADVIAHNLETVARLSPKVRDPRANYVQSLEVLRKVKALKPRVFTKSSLMLGLGEKREEIFTSMEDLMSEGVSFLTLGQYLRPSGWHLPVEAFIEPEEFRFLEEEGKRRGFLFVASGPLVRSSYRAGEYFIEHIVKSSFHQRKDHAIA